MRLRLGESGHDLWAKAEQIARDESQPLQAGHVLRAYAQLYPEKISILAKATGVPVEELSGQLTVSCSLTTDEILRLASAEANLSFSDAIEADHLFTGILFESESELARWIAKAGVSYGKVRRMIYGPHRVFTPEYRHNDPAAKANGPAGAPSQQYGQPVVYRPDLPVAVWDRPEAVDMVLEILCRRERNNPLLLTEPGMNRRSVLMGLAKRLSLGEVPPKLQGAKIIQVNAAALMAGASVHGEFEQRVLSLIEEASRGHCILLYFDGLQTLVGIGGTAGVTDAATILAPALESGAIWCIVASSPADYVRYFEASPTVAGNFQPLPLNPPSVGETGRILIKARKLYEEYHGVQISERVLLRAAELADQHLRDKPLPDTAFDLVDQTAARVAMRGARRVTSEELARVIALRTNIPVEQIGKAESERLLTLEAELKKRIKGQDHAIARVADVLRLTKSRLDLRPMRPDGIFLFVGPTGVGKTELVRALAEAMFHDERKMVRLDMSEYREPHSVAKLIGSPPGYVGSEREGMLTARIRQEPCCILLLDEVEKAHADVLNVFLQVFEDGRLTDSQGRTVSFSHVTIIMTSNLGSDITQVRKHLVGFGVNGDEVRDGLRSQIDQALHDFFRPEFLNRIDEIIYFAPLGRESLREIAVARLREAAERFASTGRKVVISDEVYDYICDRGYNPEYGARFLNRAIENLLLRPLSKLVLEDEEDSVLKIGVEGHQIRFERVAGEENR
ncbi:MAG: ATP-dependent Clp protease ATP-binding subunit [Bacillota bacterium]